MRPEATGHPPYYPGDTCMGIRIGSQAAGLVGYRTDGADQKIAS